MSKPQGGLGAGPRPAVITWLHHHRQAASTSLNRALALPLATLLTWLVVGIALALPASLLVILQNLEVAGDGLETPARFSVLLEPTTPLATAEQLAQRIEARMDVKTVALLPKDAALERFASNTGLQGLLESLPENPLPHTLLVSPRETLDVPGLTRLSDALEGFSSVEQVVFDTVWQARMDRSLQLGQRLVLGIGCLMILGAVLILANTIRLAIEARRDEIVVIKLIGASDAYARRPFLYSGLWSGMGGGLVGAAMVGSFLLYLSGPVDQLLQLYNSDLRFRGLGIIGVLAMMWLGGVMGLLSAWQASAAQLKHLEPR